MSKPNTPAKDPEPLDNTPNSEYNKGMQNTPSTPAISMDVTKVHALAGLVVVATVEYRGRRKIDIRKLYENGDNALHPTKQGIRLTADQWMPLLAGLLSAVAAEKGISHREALEQILATYAETTA